MARRPRPTTQGGPDPGLPTFRLSHLFPEFQGNRAPLPQQELVFYWTRTAEVTGGGIVYQSGKGGGKTLTGSAWIIWLHHTPKYRGLTTLIGRETYPSLGTSTSAEFFAMLERMPDAMVKSASKPGKNNMGWVDWAVGGRTLLCSLSNSDTWESANLGAAWVDEGHRQNERIVRDLMSRLRQAEGPRTILFTTNPAGKAWYWHMANPQSKSKDPNWRWIETGSDANPTLPPDYISRLIRLYGYNTPAYRRWVKGESSALEGAVFTEFDPQPTNMIHVVPAFELPKELPRGRGLDHGLANPTAVVWGAYYAADDAFFIYDTHYQAGWTVQQHAEIIKEKDRGKFLKWVPADPSMWAKIHTDKMTGNVYSNADEYAQNGVSLYPANNDRRAGLNRLFDLIAVDPDRCHYATGMMGSPRIYIFDTPANEPLIQEMANLEWDRPEGSLNRDQPDDVRKKNDHGYDALRYLVIDVNRAAVQEVEPRRPTVRQTSRGTYVGY